MNMQYDNLISDKHKIASIFNTFFTNESTDIIATYNNIMNILNEVNRMNSATTVIIL